VRDGAGGTRQQRPTSDDARELLRPYIWQRATAALDALETGRAQYPPPRRRTRLTLAAGRSFERDCHSLDAARWWCGGVADSREHRHKASDLRREFGRAEYQARDVILARSDGRPEELLRGPKRERRQLLEQLLRAV
jgi:hypothetical protein